MRVSSKHSLLVSKSLAAAQMHLTLLYSNKRSRPTAGNWPACKTPTQKWSLCTLLRIFVRGVLLQLQNSVALNLTTLRSCFTASRLRHCSARRRRIPSVIELDVASSARAYEAQYRSRIIIRLWPSGTCICPHSSARCASVLQRCVCWRQRLLHHCLCWDFHAPRRSFSGVMLL